LDFAWGGPVCKTLIYDKSVVPGVTNTIPGYGAFWFFSNVEGTLSIAPPAITSRSATTAPGNNWAAEIRANTNTQAASVYIGSASSRRTFGSAPSSDGSTISASLGSDASNPVSADLRPQGVNQTWNLTVNGPVNEPITITWPGITSVPRGWNLSLVDNSNNTRTNLRTASSYVTSGGRGVRNLTLELTRETAQRMLVSDIAVNTTRAIAPSISFNLGADGQVSVAILKANGDAVRTVVTRSVKAGVNNVVWDTRDNLGRSVVPGVYLVQVKATGTNGDTARAVSPFVIVR